MLESAMADGEGVVLYLRVFDGRRCRWDAVDCWSGMGDAGGTALMEALSAFEDLTIALTSSRGVQLSLPFP